MTRIVIKGNPNQERIDYDETLSSVSRHEAVRFFPVYVAHKNFDVSRMDLKCAFLN